MLEPTTAQLGPKSTRAWPAKRKFFCLALPEIIQYSILTRYGEKSCHAIAIAQVSTPPFILLALNYKLLLA